MLKHGPTCHGWGAYAFLGVEKSKSTKVFALSEKIRHGGNVEVPMRITLREILYDIGGGAKTSRKIKAVQLRGASGGCIPDYLFDTPVEYETVTTTGASLSGYPEFACNFILSFLHSADFNCFTLSIEFFKQFNLF